MKRIRCIFWLLLITFYSAASSYNVFEENGSVGLKDENGKVLIPARYEALGWSDGSFSMIENVIGYRLNGSWGLIRLDNQVITSAIYEGIFPGDGTLVIAKKQSSLSLRIVSGCLNTSGKEVIPFQYDGIRLYSMRAVVFTKIGNQYKYGLIDLDNKTLIPQQYKAIQPIGSLRYAVESFENKTALYTENGRQVTSFNIDSISSFKKDYAIIYQNEYQGLINRDGQIKAEPGYREVRIDDDGTLYGRQADEWLFLDGQNKLLTQTRADRIEPLGNNLLRVKTAGLIEVQDYTFKARFPMRFFHLGEFRMGKAIYSLNNRYGIARNDGSILIDAQFDSLYTDHDFFVANSRHDGKDHWIVLDSLGHAFTMKPYDRIQAFNGRIFPVVNRKFWGAIDTRGKEIIACAYDSILQQLGENLVVKFHGEYGIINEHEEWIVTPRPGRLTLIDRQRFTETYPRITYLKSIDGNVIYFSENNLVVNATGIVETLPSGAQWKISLDGVIVSRQEHTEGEVEKIYPESEGLSAIKKNGRYGFIDEKGRLRIANRYEEVRAFQEEMAAIKIRGRWGFINHDDNIAVQPIYDQVSSFSNGLSLVTQKGLQGMINKQGNQILLPRYDALIMLTTGNILVQQNALVGLADATGRILINPKYHTLEDVGNNYVIVSRDGKFGVISVQGVSTVPLIYDLIAYDPHGHQFIAQLKSSWRKLN